MPGFVRTQKDEARWSKAKSHVSSSKQKGEEDFSDQDWALVNHIYRSMKKSALALIAGELIKKCRDAQSRQEFDSYMQELVKVRGRFNNNNDDEDEPASYEEMSPEELESAGFSQFDPSEEDDEAAKWLKEQEGRGVTYDEDGEKDLEQDEPTMDEDEVDPYGSSKTVSAPKTRGQESDIDQGSEEKGAEEKVTSSKFPQPSREELNEMREHTQPWERYQREKSKLEADPIKNPVLHHNGRLIEARNEAHKGFQDAYNEFVNSGDYQNADPISQMEMDDNFKKDWHTKNPEHHQKAMQLHAEAHGKGEEGRRAFEAEKEAKIDDILRGGATAYDPEMTEEAALQHAGGTKSEEGTMIGVEKRPAASFASGNREFLTQFAQERAKRAKKPQSSEEMMDYDQGARKDAGDVLGNPPSLKDPQKKAKFDKFFSTYYPLIAINSHKVVSKLGLDKAKVDHGLLHEAGMYGLFQAMNDYDHDHPSKASFSTHASRKINGLMMTALRSQQTDVPEDLRRKQKVFERQQKPQEPAQPKSVAVSAPYSATKPSEPAAPAQPQPSAAEAPKPPAEVIGGMKGAQKDRMEGALKRIDAARSAIIRRPGGSRQ
jgi:hypothetical protein